MNLSCQGSARALAVTLGLVLGPMVVQAAAPAATPQPATPASAAVTPQPATPVTAATTPLAPMTQEQLLTHLRQHPDHLFVLDVRTPQEYAEGHVPGAVNVPHDQVAARLAEIPRDKDVVLYCRSGRRAQAAADVLATHGYKRMTHLEGDMPAWIERGRPVEK
jgi:phage shock protein E